MSATKYMQIDAPLDETSVPREEELNVLAQAVIGEAVARGLTLGTAESCTGGLVCATLTNIAGSSQAVKGSIVSYALSVKHKILGVDQAILDNPQLGAVSAECAGRMAEGACVALESDVSVSITGIAGPGGAEPGKPVGTVWFGCKGPASHIVCCAHFNGTRSEVRFRAVRCALRLLLDTARTAK